MSTSAFNRLSKKDDEIFQHRRAPVRLPVAPTRSELNGHRELRLKHGKGAEFPRETEIEKAPELGEAILNRRPVMTSR